MIFLANVNHFPLPYFIVPYDFWLEESNTKAAYGVDPNVTYQDCVESVYNTFFPDIGTSYASNYSYLLN
jgi:hypothetical protein